MTIKERPSKPKRKRIFIDGIEVKEPKPYGRLPQLNKHQSLKNFNYDLSSDSST